MRRMNVHLRRASAGRRSTPRPTGVHDSRTGIEPSKRSPLNPEFVRIHGVVIVDELYPWCYGFSPTRVPGSRWPGVHSGQDGGRNPRPPQHLLSQHSRLVGRAVIDDDDLESFEVLLEQRFEGSLDAFRGIVGRHHDADRGLGHVAYSRHRERRIGSLGPSPVCGRRALMRRLSFDSWKRSRPQLAVEALERAHRPGRRSDARPGRLATPNARRKRSPRLG